MAALRFLIPKVCWTEALFDGKAEVEGFQCSFEASPFDQRTSRRLRGEVEPDYAGTEQVLTDFIVRLSRGVEVTLAALPVFVTRGMVHRKLVTRRSLSGPADLRGRAVGMGRVLGATSVFLRGLLDEEFGVGRSAVKWSAAEPVTSDGAMGGEWQYLSGRGQYKASDLIARLGSGELDAVLYPGGAGGHWFNWLVEGGVGSSPDPYGDLEQMVRSNPAICFPIGGVAAHVEWFKKRQIYPLFHCMAVRREMAEKNPGLASALVSAFEKAAALAPRYMSAEERSMCEKEAEVLGADPNRCGLTPLHRRTVGKCVDYLVADGLIQRRPGVRELFPLTLTLPSP